MGYANLRTGRRSIVGQHYLVTFNTARRDRHFSDDRLAIEACRVMTSARAWPRSRLLAWVLMPDHWHGLIELGDEPLHLCVARLKALSARNLRHAVGSPVVIWAPGFHDRALRRSDQVEHVARYLVMNPVRAGLVARAGEYSFWDAIWLDTARG